MKTHKTQQEDYPCPCCGFLTLSEPGTGSFEICEVCGWEDDDLQAKNPQFSGGANPMSLKEAKKNFASFGAISEEKKAQVRTPLISEHPGN